jgi:hypothetical protein
VPAEIIIASTIMDVLVVEVALYGLAVRAIIANLLYEILHIHQAVA